MELKRRSKSGGTLIKHTIHFEILNPKIYAASLALNHFYYMQDLDNLHRKREALINFSRSYLTRLLEKKGYIKCHYCPKDNLVIEYEGMKVPLDKLATIDHVVPMSRGGAAFDEKNVVPCCNKCNQKKGNKIL